MKSQQKTMIIIGAIFVLMFFLTGCNSKNRNTVANNNTVQVSADTPATEDSEPDAVDDTQDNDQPQPLPFVVPDRLNGANIELHVVDSSGNVPEYGEYYVFFRGVGLDYQIWHKDTDSSTYGNYVIAMQKDPDSATLTVNMIDSTRWEITLNLYFTGDKVGTFEMYDAYDNAQYGSFRFY